MLTRSDLKEIQIIVREEVRKEVHNEISDFAILVKRQFDRIESALEQKADKKDILRIEGYMLGHNNRIDRLEDDMRTVKTKLKLS